MTKKIKSRFKSALLVFLAILIVFAQLCAFAFWGAPLGKHYAQNKEALKTDVVVPPPDSVAVIRYGVAIEVSKKKRDQIYAAFAQAIDKKRDNAVWMSSIGLLRTAKCLMFNMSVEFRYEQTREITGQRYDAVLFSFEEDDVLIPIHLCDGQYNYNNSYRTLGVSSNLKKTIKDIL